MKFFISFISINKQQKGSMEMKILLFVFILLVYIGITFFIGFGLMKTLIAFGIYRWPIVYWSILTLFSGSIFLSRIKNMTIFQVLGNYWMFIFQYGFLFTFVGVIIYYLTPLKNLRIIGGTGIGIFFVLLIAGLYFAYQPTSRIIEMEVDKKADDLKIIVASDFHLGVLSTKNHLERFVELANKENPDLVLLVGDIIDDDPKWFIEQNMDETLAKLKTTYGVYGVLGNHEYYGKKTEPFLEVMKKANVTMLLDETILINDAFYLTGQEDLTNKNRLPLEALKPLDETKPWIIMNHTPTQLEVPTQLQADLHLSGHTHKGQLWPNNYLTNRLFEVDYGYLKKETTHFLVSSGYGFWGPPMRIGSQAELWVVHLNFTHK